MCGFSTVDNMALLNFEGSGMLGVPGIAHRLFGSLHSHGISVNLIAQVRQTTGPFTDRMHAPTC